MSVDGCVRVEPIKDRLRVRVLLREVRYLGLEGNSCPRKITVKMLSTEASAVATSRRGSAQCAGTIACDETRLIDMQCRPDGHEGRRVVNGVWRVGTGPQG